MKKIFALMLALTMMITAFSALAEDTTTGATNSTQQTEERQDRGQKGPMQGQGGRMDGQGRGGMSPMNGQMPGGRQRGGMPGMNGQQGPMNGQMPGQSGNGQQAPMNGQVPGQPGNGQTPAGAPDMIDFDAMVTRGVISQETCDRIKAYMQEHVPADNGMPAVMPPMDGQAPAAENGSQPMTPPEQMNTVPERTGGLLDELLGAGIITQAEYEALTAAQDVTAV